MMGSDLQDLREAVLKSTQWDLSDYYNLSHKFLNFIGLTRATRIICPFPLLGM